MAIVRLVPRCLAASWSACWISTVDRPGFSFEKAEVYYGMEEDDPRSDEGIARSYLDVVTP